MPKDDCDCDWKTTSCRLVVILLYDCDAWNSWVNYSIVTLTTLSLGLLLHKAATAFADKFFVLSNSFLWAFQIGLCFMLSSDKDGVCMGISIVWSAHIGIMWFLYNAPQFLPKHDRMEVIIAINTFVAMCAWLFYLFTDVFLTTLAHFAAVGLGILIGAIYIKIQPYDHLQQEEGRIIVIR